MNTDYAIYLGDCLDVLPKLPHAQMIFADPPDNIGLKYDNMLSDNKPDEAYRALLQKWMNTLNATVIWLSVNAKWQHVVRQESYCCWYEPYWGRRWFIWYFTFGQHNQNDCGNNYRPLFRIAPKDFKWNTDAIRIPSKRQKMGDKRADPRGRVPGDVWGGPEDIPGFCRIQGNNKERRKWHPTQHPEALVERCVLMSTKPGDLVIDPFGGTFTTLRVCKRLNRRCISIDISEQYCEKAAAENNVEVTT